MKCCSSWAAPPDLDQIQPPQQVASGPPLGRPQGSGPACDRRAQGDAAALPSTLARTARRAGDQLMFLLMFALTVHIMCVKNHPSPRKNVCRLIEFRSTPPTKDSGVPAQTLRQTSWGTKQLRSSGSPHLFPPTLRAETLETLKTHETRKRRQPAFEVTHSEGSRSDAESDASGLENRITGSHAPPYKNPLVASLQKWVLQIPGSLEAKSPRVG